MVHTSMKQIREGSDAIGVHGSGVQPCEEGCEGVVVVVQWLSE